MSGAREAIELIRERLTELEHAHSLEAERAAKASLTAEGLRTRMNDLRAALAMLGEGDDEPSEAQP